MGNGERGTECPTYQQEDCPRCYKQPPNQLGHREGDLALLGKLGEKDRGLTIEVSKRSWQRL